MSDPIVKVMVTAGVLQDIMAKNPAVEVELIGSAVAQIAGRVAQRVTEKLPKVKDEVDRAFDAQVASIKNSTRLHPEIKATIRGFIDAECKEFVKAQLAKEVTEQALVRVNELVKARMLKAEEEVTKIVADGQAKLDAYLVKRAGEEFVKLVRGASAVTGVA